MDVICENYLMDKKVHLKNALNSNSPKILDSYFSLAFAESYKCSAKKPRSPAKLLFFLI